ncbi:uncharacterized protein TRUGW13939_05105 [Talaromyces rugulosus]|uniref:FAD-binding domain-containing protein n=1 Tax=Talaromyces rugulosus TaxID=121627 RepID=A0A7H8QWV0_TALRU|nr:uncharacterized protein TRUGW13939_05105 [Talaromyces rugulosus]QKX57985.1 hypothetical protein TRUGW13939_05105 [Talaromyces rugulosus]
MARLRVLISGGVGVAGPALAYWLSKLGHEITLVERFPTLRASGQQIDLRGHGIQSMKQMGLEDAWRAKSVAESGIQFVDSAGRRKGFFPVNQTGRGLQGFTTDWEIMRGDLCTLLYDQTRDSVKYRFGVAVEGMAQGVGKDKTVRVSFSDGSKDTFDLVVGADGQGSRMRSMILPPGTKPYRSLHMFLAYFTISQQPGTDYISTAYLAPNKRLLFTSRHSPDSIQAYMGYADDSEKLQCHA